MLPQVWKVPVNVAVGRNEEPVRVSDTHQIPNDNNTLSQKRYTFPQITTYAVYSEPGVITDVLIAKITRRKG